MSARPYDLAPKQCLRANPMVNDRQLPDHDIFIGLSGHRHKGRGLGHFHKPLVLDVQRAAALLNFAAQRDRQRSR